jgi:opacity protein-like surface antigen
MNAKSLLIVAASVAAFAGAAHADDITIDPAKFESTRTRAEVQAEAAKVPATRSTEPAGSRVIAAPKSSTINVQTLRAETVQAVRSGQIPQGEIGRF